jgi:hypothetical protein
MASAISRPCTMWRRRRRRRAPIADRAVAALALAAALVVGAPARAFTLAEIESDLAMSAQQRAQLEKGQVVSRTVASSNERELAVGLAVKVDRPPAELAKQLLGGLAQRQNPDVLKRGTISSGALADFAGVKLKDAAAAQAYLSAKPGSALNLSAAEIAAFQALAKQPTTSTDPKKAVEGLIQQQLQARYQSYNAKGLAGIAPYARASGEARPAEDLLAATRASKFFAKYTPKMLQLLTDYPKGRPSDLDEREQWAVYNANGARAIILQQLFALPDGDAWSVAARQYYVSTSYNAEQNLMLFVPAAEGGTVAFMLSRVSTEQVAGFGGSMKRGIGSKMMADTLSGIAARVRQATGKK